MITKSLNSGPTMPAFLFLHLHTTNLIRKNVVSGQKLRECAQYPLTCAIILHEMRIVQKSISKPCPFGGTKLQQLTEPQEHAHEIETHPDRSRYKRAGYQRL
ncbi:hypothetical protein [uncultured Microbulbifer sp.]|uniref:hypothetical protein n=1 Tax=uncultured Microbulbifer sp. TaxID=348147 RepID=UPI0026313325|nr:hypothetical protein [uncultured Microbulbifer sp.]